MYLDDCRVCSDDFGGAPGLSGASISPRVRRERALAVNQTCVCAKARFVSTADKALGKIGPLRYCRLDEKDALGS